VLLCIVCQVSEVR